MVKFDKLDSAEGLEALNKYLVDYSYIEGYVLSAADFEHHAAAGSAPDSKKYPHAARWFSHISSFSEEERAHFGAPAAPAQKQEKKANDDDFDLFGEDAEADAAHEAEIERRAEEQMKKKKESGKMVVAKSTIVLDVKPWDDETNLAEMEEKVRGIEREGLTWGKSQLVEIGYGIKKLQISAVVVDDLVSVDEVSETICAYEDLVQSVDIAAFNKL
eukprot:TRINITY_DN9283_c0_g1_i1.p1 TRINITY_DN9283_c0_g1~~TRINITY_DN9283_c0_g1_i1.p1  ORF type:complete len:233 (-),score=83.74 TRINITY_DN9283_c0_g1_i1:73-720(-)